MGLLGVHAQVRSHSLEAMGLRVQDADCPAGGGAQRRQAGRQAGRTPGAPAPCRAGPGLLHRPPEPQVSVQPGPASPSAMAQQEARKGSPRSPAACPEHSLRLSCFCCTERRLMCDRCSTCPQDHHLRPLDLEAGERRNKIVDQCEKLQLQSATISKYAAGVLPEKKQQVVSAASKAREVLIQHLNLVRNLCDSEEQRLLDTVHTEEERAHQSILTQQAHWTESLRKLDALRNYMVTMITATDDSSLVQAEEEIFERMEEAEGILKPQESEKLNFNPRCIQSPLVSRLWALAVLCWASDEVHIDEKTVSPLLVLSEDKKTLTFSPKKTRADLDGPARFNHWPNALAEESFHTGIHAWRVRVTKSGAYKLGVSYGSLPRKGVGPEARLGYNPWSWVFSRYDKEFQFSHNDHHQVLELLKCPAEIGILIDLDAGELLFYDPESYTVLHAHQELFTAPVYPCFAVADQTISLLR